MGLEQIPGACSITFVKGDDYSPIFTIPFDIAGFTWIATAHLTSGPEVIINTTSEAISSAQGTISVNFQSSITSTFASTKNGKYHSWKLKGISPTGIVRTYIADKLEIV